MLFFLFFLLFIIAIFSIKKCLKSGNNILYIVFLSTFTLYYIVVPMLLSLYAQNEQILSNSSTFIKIIRNSPSADRIRALFIIAFTLFLIILLRNVVFRFKGVGNLVARTDTKVGDTCGLYSALHITGLVFLLIGGISLLILSFELGSLSKMLSLGATIRGYQTSNDQYLSPFGAIAKTLSMFCTGSFFCFFSVRKRYNNKLLLVISFIFSIIVLLFNAGRGTLIVFGGSIILSYLAERRKRITWLVIISFIGIAAFSSSLEIVMNNLANGLGPFSNLNYNFTENIISTIGDLSFPYANVIEFPNIIKTSGYNYFTDYLTWIFQIIPKRVFSLIGIPLPDIKLVTLNVSNYYIHCGMSIGGTPADFITFGLFQLNILGLCINAIVYTSLIKIMNKIVVNAPIDCAIIKYRTCFFVYSVITGGDLPLLIKNNLFLIIILIIIKHFMGADGYD